MKHELGWERNLRHSCLRQISEALTPAPADLEWQDWRQIARPEQLPPPGDWSVWLIVTGRGWGKTRTAAECVRLAVEEGGHRHIGIIGPTAGDVRDVMIEGESGLLSVFPPSRRPSYEPSKQRVTFVNGAVANLRSADEPKRVRGLQFTFLWADELCAWRYPEGWDVLQFGNRLNRPRPRAVVTTTPVPGHQVLMDLLGSPGTYVTRGTMRDNVENLSEDRVRELEAKYGATSLGRQELEGEILDQARGALWLREWFEALEFRLPPAFGRVGGKLEFRPPVGLQRISVAIDPSVSDPERRKNPHRDPDECGLVVGGLDLDGNPVVLGDFTAIMPPGKWAQVAVQLYGLTDASGIVAEANQGGALITEVLRGIASHVPIRLVHATQAKRPRAEPVALMYEQGRVRHCGDLAALEREMMQWDPAVALRSPNRIDALVWLFHDLGLTQATGGRSTTRLRTNETGGFPR